MFETFEEPVCNICLISYICVLILSYPTNPSVYIQASVCTLSSWSLTLLYRAIMFAFTFWMIANYWLAYFLLISKDL